MLFNNESSSNEMSVTELHTVAATHTMVAYLILFIQPLGALLVAVPCHCYIDEQKAEEIAKQCLLCNLLIADVLATLLRWIITFCIDC